MSVIVITPPDDEPVSLAEIKAQLGVTTDSDDAMIERKIKAARQYIERFTGQILISTTLELVCDKFPSGPLQIPRGPLQSITSVNYIDRDTGLEAILPSDRYEVDTASDPGWIAPAVSGWPATMATINAARIRFVAGYGKDADDVPEPLREAAMQLAAHWYENREASLVGVSAQALPYGVESILADYRNWSWS